MKIGYAGYSLTSKVRKSISMPPLSESFSLKS